MTVFLLVMQIIFVLQDNAIIVLFESLTERFDFHDLSCILKYQQDVYSFS